MKRVNPDVLARMALAKGASIKIDGKQINAAGDRVAVEARPKVVPITERAPAPAPAPIDTTGLVQAAQSQRESADRLVQIVAMLLQEVRARPADRQPAKHGWDFEMVRDAQGRLASIKARPLAEGE